MTIFINKVPKYTPLYSLSFTEICQLVNVDPHEGWQEITWRNKTGTKSGRVELRDSVDVIDHMEITIEQKQQKDN